jgi:hypothetical protein
MSAAWWWLMFAAWLGMAALCAFYLPLSLIRGGWLPAYDLAMLAANLAGLRLACRKCRGRGK